MAERSAALVPAAGRGERLGLGPKAFVPLAGRSLLERTVAALRGGVDEIVVAVPAERTAAAARLLPGARVIEGGATRQATVAALLGATDADLLLVHDAARPFLPPEVRDAALAAARANGAASVVRRVADTLVDARSGATVDRDPLRAVQTPQAFRRALLERAHAEAARAGVQATDDAALVRRLGAEVALVEGSAFLLKITTGEDLALAEALLPAWERRLATGAGA